MPRLRPPPALPLAGLLAAALALAGCPGGDTGTASATDSTGGATTGAPGTGSTTGEPDPTVAATTTTGEPDPTTEATTNATTASETTGSGDAYEQSCEAACARIVECFPDEFYPDVESCKTACLPGASDEPACRAAAATFNECTATMECDALLDGLLDEEYGDCADEYDAYGMACM